MSFQAKNRFEDWFRNSVATKVAAGTLAVGFVLVLFLVVVLGFPRFFEDEEDSLPNQGFRLQNKLKMPQIG